MDESVFVKQKKKNPPILDINDVMTSIPPDYYNTEQPDLKKEKEFRWRFLQINDKKYVEISIHEQGHRTYINKNGIQIESFVPKEFDKYVTKTIYYYPSDDTNDE